MSSHSCCYQWLNKAYLLTDGLHYISKQMSKKIPTLIPFSFQWGQYAHPIFSKDGDFPPELKHNIAMKSADQGYLQSRLPVLSAAEVTLIRGSSDFFGMNTYTSKLTYRDASLEGMYAVPSYYDDMGAVMIKDPSWPQAQSTWLQVSHTLCH